MDRQSSILIGLFAWFTLLGAGSAPGQEPPKYVVGFIDHRDDRTGTTGIETLLANEPSVQRHRFDLQRPETWIIESCDMIFVGSFSERAPGWGDFVRQAKPRVLEFVRSGGVLVRMNRYRWADDKRPGAQYAQPDLLPPGYTVTRGGDDPRNLFLGESEHPIWHRMTGRPIDGGWHRLSVEKIGNERLFLDAFEDWSSQFRKSAGADRDAYRKNDTAALHAQFGRGWLMLFQLTIDKFDGINDKNLRRQSERFIDNLITWARDTAGTRVKTAPPPVRPDPPIEPRPRPEDPPPVFVPPPRSEPTTALVRGRVFLDANGNGRFEAGEPTVEGATIGDERRVKRSGDGGRYQMTISRSPGRCLTIEPPPGYRAAASSFRRFSEPAPERIDEDFALVPLDAESRR
ncbi:MAG: hypothetical protein KDB18_13520, partial [Salinibacterium sp.]|nr:hypothetical protein [Salinibacterium sp.]